MRKTIVGIFAHPDDEAFGPGGTLAILSKTNDVYLICVTKGEAGKNSLKTVKSLEMIRKKELNLSAKTLGIKKVFFLNFDDGSLSNNLYHTIADKIKDRLIELKPNMIITYEPRGISGHIDHITVSMVSSFLFWKLDFIKEMWQFCRISNGGDKKQDYFIYFPPGYKKSEINKIVKTDEVWDTKIKAMLCHKSQIHDFKRIIKVIEKSPKEEYFIVIDKS